MEERDPSIAFVRVALGVANPHTPHLCYPQPNHAALSMHCFQLDFSEGFSKAASPMCLCNSLSLCICRFRFVLLFVLFPMCSCCYFVCVCVWMKPHVNVDAMASEKQDVGECQPLLDPTGLIILAHTHTACYFWLNVNSHWAEGWGWQSSSSLPSFSESSHLNAMAPLGPSAEWITLERKIVEFRSVERTKVKFNITFI